MHKKADLTVSASHCGGCSSFFVCIVMFVLQCNVFYCFVLYLIESYDATFVCLTGC